MIHHERRRPRHSRLECDSPRINRSQCQSILAQNGAVDTGKTLLAPLVAVAVVESGPAGWSASWPPAVACGSALAKRVGSGRVSRCACPLQKNGRVVPTPPANQLRGKEKSRAASNGSMCAKASLRIPRPQRSAHAHGSPNPRVQVRHMPTVCAQGNYARARSLPRFVFNAANATALGSRDPPCS